MVHEEQDARRAALGLWSRGDDVALTWRRSQVQFLASPPLIDSNLSEIDIRREVFLFLSISPW